MGGLKLLLLFNFLFVSCSLFQSKEDVYKQKSLQLQEIINNGDGATLYSQLSPGFQKGFPPPMVSAFLARIYGYCGRLLELGDGQFVEDKYTLYPQFSSNNCYIKYSLNDKGKFNYLLIDRKSQSVPEINLKKGLEFAERTDALSNHYFKHSEMKGLAVGVIEDSKIKMLFYGDGGEESLVLDGDSLFQIGSITKLYNALLILKLSQQNKVDLESELVSVFPRKRYRFWFEKNRFKPSLADATLHLSGLPRLPLNLKSSMEQPYEKYSAKMLYQGLRNVHLASEPGQKFLYSNWGAALAGHHVSLKLKRSYDDILFKELIKPLGLESTFNSDKTPNRLVYGYSGKIRKDPWKLGLFMPAGGLASSVKDQLKFLAEALAAREDKKHWMNDSFEIQKVINSHNAVAWGWLVRGSDDQQIYWHNGGTGSFSSFLGIKGNKGIVLLSNSANVPVTELGFKILE